MTEPGYATTPTNRYQRPSMAGLLIGNYRLLDEISTGGMGTVYRAKHELIGRPAAVKLLRPDLYSRQELVDRFFNEAKAASAVRHPGIVEIYDFGYTDEGHGYLVMELLVGKTLTSAIAAVERYSESEAAAIARGIASALKAAHAQRIYHRDLKPDNVFLVPDLEGPTGAQRPKVLDFGIAKLSEGSGHTQMGMLIGTPQYMAPEQAREASAVDHRADLYSLGCILYHMLVGHPPFVSEGAGEIVAMHLMNEPDPPRALAPHISREMNDIVMRLLEKEPDRRFQTAGELAAALAPLMDPSRTDLITAGPRSPQRQIPTAAVTAAPTIATPRRSSLPIIIAAVVATLVIALIGLVASRSSSSTPQEPTAPLPEKRENIEAKPAPEPAPAPRAVPEQPAVETKQVPGKQPIVVQPPAPATPTRIPQPAIKRPRSQGNSPIETDLGEDKQK